MYVRRSVAAPVTGRLATDGPFVAPAPRVEPERVPVPWAELALALAHIPLALAIQYGSTLLTFVHAATVILIGLKWAMDGGRAANVAMLAAYVAGCEVLWRMTNDRLYWETGKYAVVLILAVAFVRDRGLRAAPLPALYFLTLLPSVVLTLRDLEWTEARNGLSFNLSGPLALMTAGVFFWDLKLTARDRHRILLAMAGPIFGVAALALAGIVTNPNITFTTESNFETSGGFGPNQVSAALGLAALALWLVVQDAALTMPQRVVCLAGMIWMIAQSAMTFSRGGLYGAAVGLACGLPFLAGRRTLSWQIVALPAVLYVAWLALWPALDRFTEGKLAERFQDTELTKRGEISENDYAVFLRYPVLGVGPGVSHLERADRRAPHTEFTRLLSEHGSFGLGAMIVLVIGAAWRILTTPSPRHRAMVASMFGWAIAYMTNAAMRLVAPSFAIGLALAGAADEARQDEHEAPEDEPTGRRRWGRSGAA